MNFTTHAPASGDCAVQPGDGHGGEGLHAYPSAGASPTHAFIFLHGLGDTAHGWVDFVRYLRQRKGVFERFKFILPTAPIRPVTLNGGFPMPCWADIYGLSIQDKEDREGYDASVNRILRIIDKEIEQGIAPANIYLGGFSQGGATSYLTVLTQKERTLGGVIVLSGWLPFVRHDPKRFAIIPDKTLRTPVLHCHGTADLMVTPEWGKATVQELKSMGFSTHWIAYRDMGHTASPEVFRDAAEFIETRVQQHSQQ